MGERYTRRRFIGYGAVAGLAVVLPACSSGSSDRRSGAAGQGQNGGSAGAFGAREGLPDIESAELVTDSSEFPTSFNERPEFAEMVAAGTLPPVAERIGEDPLVLRPLNDIGVYGGTIRRAYLGVSDAKNASFFCSGPDTLLYWDRTRRDVIPNVAKGYELSDDGMEMVLTLRRGMHWSDGTPFTADDIIFWRDDITLHPELPGLAASLRVDGQPVRVEKVDDFTVRYVSSAPHPLLPQLMATPTDIGGAAWIGETLEGGYAPKHYLSQFHPAYVGEAEANRLAAAASFNGWVAHLQYLNTYALNTDLPTFSPWITVRSLNDPPHTFGPNPYSIWVDTEGNQLPYIGEITHELAEERNVVVLKATNGEFDFQDIHLEVASLPVLLENQERSGYTIHRTPREKMDFGVRINLAYDRDPVIGELIRTTDFRRALGLGIDRDQLNEAFLLGTAIPTATLPTDDSVYFPGAEWRTRWATHDPEQASELLDSIGLTETDGSGFRLRPDGNGHITMDYQAGVSFYDRVGVGEMIKTQWAEIGIDMVVTEITGSLAVERANANELMLSGHSTGTDDPFIDPGAFLPVVTGQYQGMIGLPYADWYASDGAAGVEPPASLQKLKDAVEMYFQGLRTVDEDERNEIGKELFRMHVDEVWSIGCLGYGMAVYGMYLANNDLLNVPARVLNTNAQFTPVNTFPMTFYYET
jgi:peptide/nickel transport system substrate-binding protein